jgi:long-subunit fatty acid transport protein
LSAPVPGLTFFAELDFERWSTAPPPQVSVSVKLQGAALEALGLSRALDFKSSDAAPGFSDILYPRLGVSYALGEALELRGGYVYRPTMLPNQRYESNYLDSDSHLISFGVGWSFTDPTEVFTRPVHIDAALQLTHLADRKVQKASATDPVGNYRFGGDVFDVTAGLRYEF